MKTTHDRDDYKTMDRIKKHFKERNKLKGE